MNSQLPTDDLDWTIDFIMGARRIFEAQPEVRKLETCFFSLISIHAWNEYCLEFY